MQKSEKDIVMELWHHLSSPEISQAAFVYMPDQLLAQIDFSELPGAAPRRAFTAQQIKEFGKTANAVMQSPWRLQRASAYIKALISSNQNPSVSGWVLPDITLAMSPCAPGEGHTRADDDNGINRGDLAFCERSAALCQLAPTTRSSQLQSQRRNLPQRRRIRIMLLPRQSDHCVP